MKKAENWRWSSVWIRENGTIKQRQFLATWPVTMPKDYLIWLNQAQTAGEEEAIERAITKGNPYGNSSWVDEVIKRFGLEQTLRRVGRPNK